MTTTLIRVGSHFFNLATMFEIVIREPSAKARRETTEVQLLRGEIAGRSVDGPDAELLRDYLEGTPVGRHTYPLPGGIQVIHLLPPEPGVVVDVEAIEEEGVAS